MLLLQELELTSGVLWSPPMLERTLAIAEWRMYRMGNTALLEPLSETKILLNPMLEAQWSQTSKTQ